MKPSQAAAEEPQDPGSQGGLRIRIEIADGTASRHSVPYLTFQTLPLTSAASWLLRLRASRGFNQDSSPSKDSDNNTIT